MFIGSGDIARCGSDGDERTARIVDSVLKADSVAGVEDRVFTTGDNAYPAGSLRDFEVCFGQSWGDPKKRIMKRIHPTPGNHEHYTNSAAPYYEYFGSGVAGSAKRGYYAYDLGVWRVIALNTEIVVNPIFPKADEAAQEAWLKNELKTTTKDCTIAYFHHPRYSSGWHGSDARIAPIWQILMDGGADVVIAGHDHHYERLAPLDAVGAVDTVKGIPSFVIGTGGGDLRGLQRTLAPARVSAPGTLRCAQADAGCQGVQLRVHRHRGPHWDPGGGKCK